MFLVVIDFSRTLQSLARRGDADLMDIFHASFEENRYNTESFDKEFFIDNARGVVEDYRKLSK